MGKATTIFLGLVILVFSVYFFVPNEKSASSGRAEDIKPDFQNLFKKNTVTINYVSRSGSELSGTVYLRDLSRRRCLGL